MRHTCHVEIKTLVFDFPDPDGSGTTHAVLGEIRLMERSFAEKIIKDYSDGDEFAPIRILSEQESADLDNG